MQWVDAGVDVQHEVHLVQIAVALEACDCTGRKQSGLTCAQQEAMPLAATADAITYLCQSACRLDRQLTLRRYRRK